MTYAFYKYQGTGNDFIMIDNRLNTFRKKDTEHIAFLCDRRFGIGADGLILLEAHTSADFKMIYFNSDGNESSMCGNGGRCIVAFAKHIGIIDKDAVFEAIDGMHHATIKEDIVRLQMQNVSKIEKHDGYTFLDTGSPHHVEMTDNLKEKDIKKEGAKIRYSNLYNEAGSNVNFVSRMSDDIFSVRTYERGVEDETLSCGTGVTAVALAMHSIGETEKNRITLQTVGGNLDVSFKKTKDGYQDIWLIGPAKQVFKGTIL